MLDGLLHLTIGSHTTTAAARQLSREPTTATSLASDLQLSPKPILTSKAYTDIPIPRNHLHFVLACIRTPITRKVVQGWLRDRCMLAPCGKQT